MHTVFRLESKQIYGLAYGTKRKSRRDSRLRKRTGRNPTKNTQKLGIGPKNKLLIMASRRCNDEKT